MERGKPNKMLVGALPIVAVLLLLAVPGPAAAQLIWEPLASFTDPRTGGGGVEGAAASLIGDKLWVSHGYRPGDTLFHSVYDIPTDTWTHGGPTAPDALVIRSEEAGGTANGKHYSIGGRPGVAAPGGPGDSVEEFTPGGGWVGMSPMPTPRRGLGMGSLGGLIYAAGGSDGGSPGAGIITGAFEVFDPLVGVGGTWTPLAPMPVPLMDVEATIALGPAVSGTVAGAVYVFGGRDALGAAVSTVQIYDIAAGVWGLGAPMPTARSNAMAGLVACGAAEDGMIAVFGGADTFFINLTVTELYAPLTDTWSPGPPMLFPTSEQAVGVTWDGTGIYSVGSGIFGAASTVVERLVCKPVEPKWTQLPHGDGQGFNVASDVDWQTLAKQPPGLPGPGPNWVVADDFQSDGRPITCVRWWGSYLDPAFEPGPPTGACCLPDGTCTDGVTAADCAALAGFYLGDGTTCVGAPCFLQSRGKGAEALQHPADDELRTGAVAARTAAENRGRYEAMQTRKTTLSASKSTVAATSVNPTPRNLGPGGADDCALATPIGDVTDLPFDTTLATHDGPGASCGAAATSPNIWFCYTATCTGMATVDTCGSAYDTVLAVYDGCSPIGPEIACNDDFCGLQSSITWAVTAGQQYKIEVAGFSGATGTGDLTVSCIGGGGGVCIPPGIDCWSTQCGSSFADFSGTPIPADFFDPGSLPFDGVINLGGGPGLIDTQVQRLGQMCFPDPLPATDTVQIELVALDLVSCQPITVQGSGDWDVQVGLSGPQPPGQMTVTKEDANGGTFNSDLFVQPVYIFSRVGNPADIRVLDTLQLGIPPILLQSIFNACWSTDESLEQCTRDGFAAGVCGGGCCKPVCHSSGGSPPAHQHCTTPPLWPPCPQDVDGWLVSFHTDLPIGPLGFSEPLDLLGLYFCPKSVITIQPTQVFGWDGHRVFEYFVELQDCHLIHSLLDPRPGATPPDPAQPDAFLETQNFIYWLDIQAVVGHTFTHGKADLFGSEPIGGGGGGTSQIWDITVPGGPDALIGPPVHPIAALSGLANCGGSIIGVTGNAGGGTIHTFTFGGVLTSSRASGLAVVTSLAGASTAPPASAALGFTPGNVYATAGTGAFPPLTDALVDLGPCGAGPDVLVGPLLDAATGAPIGGIDGLAFDQTTGILYGSTGFGVAPPGLGAPNLVTIGAGGLVTVVGPILVGGAAPAGTVAGLAFSEGTLYGSLGTGVGDIIAIPPAAPGASVFDHAVTGGLGSIAGLTFQQAWVEVETTNWAKDHFWGWHTSPDLFNDESVMGMLAMSGGEWLYQDWQVVDGTPHMLPRVDQAFELLTPIVPPSCPCLGDMDGSGILDGLDIQGFVDCMLGVAAPGINCACADMNGDGVIDLVDRRLFITAVLTKTPCP